MQNLELHQAKLKGVTKTLFKKAIFLCYLDGIKNRAPLGFSGDDITLFGKSYPRVSVIQVRNYNGDAELLITDKVGGFLFYGRFDINMGVEFIADQYWKIFNNLKPYIEYEVVNISDFHKMEISNKFHYTDYLDGFNELKKYQLKPPPQCTHYQ